ncbi:ankyrin repeat-containing domain protein [Colletotrichum lupini]|nr:ankyrin repeat-containing domain protein [Colletotrichum lupini]
MASSRKRHSDEEWLQHRAEIQNMFLNESASFNKIMRKLEEDGFPVTKSQLEYKLKVWGLRRRIQKNKTEMLWQFVDGRLSMREKQGKLSEVIHDGKIIMPAKVKKERGRYKRVSFASYQRENLSPRTPPELNISVCTPVSFPMTFAWSKSLPWLQFQSIYPQLSQDFGTRMRIDTERNFSNSLGDSDVWSILDMPESSNKSNVLLLAAQLGSMMPEAEEGENTGLAQALLKAPSQTTIHEYHKFLIYRISNNMENDTSGELDFSRWFWTVNVLETSGIMNLKLATGKTSSPTISAFIEKLFQIALPAMHELFWNDYDTHEVARAKRVVQWLLSLGQSPNTQIKVVGEALTPLEVAVGSHESRLALQLLDAGADPSLSYVGFGDFLVNLELLGDYENAGLDPVMTEVFKRVVDFGLSQGESIAGDRPSSLMEVTRFGTIPLIDILVQRGANVLYCSSGDNDYLRLPFSREVSVLGCAAGILDEARAKKTVEHLLDRAQSINPYVPRPDFIKVDVIMNVVSRGHLAVLNFLHSIGCDVVGAESKGITSLHMAAAFGFPNVCRWLLSHGSSVHGPYLSNEAPTPLTFAAFGRNYDVVQLLHHHGADLNGSFAINPGSCSWINYCPAYYRQELRNGLSQLGNCFMNPAGAAILRGDWDNPTYNYLAQNGARMPEWAVYYGSLEVREFGLIEVALKDHAYVDWWGFDGNTPLQAVMSTSKKAVGRFLKGDQAEDIRAKVVRACISLLGAGACLMGNEVQLAMALNNCSLVEAIERHDVERSGQLKSAVSLLEAAFLSGFNDMVQYMFKRSPEAYDGGALCAAVHFASEHKCTKFLQRLLQNRQNFECPSLLEGTAIGLAVFKGEMQALRMLCGHIGMPLSAVSPSSKTIWNALYEWTKALRHLPFWHDKHTKVTEPLLFILESLQFELKLQDLGYRSWEHLIQVALNIDSEETLEIRLFSSESDIRPEQQKDKSMLFLVTRDGRLKSVEIEDFHQKTYMICGRGRSPLQQAVEDGDLTKIDLLLGAGADINAPAADQAGATALQLAAITGRIGIAKMLIDMGADVDAPRAPESGRTALEGAAEHGRMDMIQLLLSEGAETGGKGRLQYMRAIKFAEQQGHLVAANMLREYRDWTVDDDDLWSELGEYPASWDKLDENDFIDYDLRIDVEDGEDTPNTSNNDFSYEDAMTE